MTRQGALATVAVGTDVVDLADPRTHGKAQDERFVGRVLDAVEAVAVRRANEADIELWSHWAGKEAAFKVATKLLGGPPVFEHAAFGVRWDDLPREDRLRTGRVLYREWSFPLEVMASREVLRAVASVPPSLLPGPASISSALELLDMPAAPWSAPLEVLLAHLTPREADAVRSRPSAAVRLAARAALTRLLRVDEQRVEIVCDAGPPGRRPPRVVLDGRPANADVSLSHHGRWIAWAVQVLS